ncbi:hypothetical protein CP533_2434 [Ophiocordyceps camponoti-saundersi (nom. inval.)]|nr:hypothetical protein CP533_2434 [Ophiocordyceps camponoti-saundersi (nom. inval.)]
MDCTYGIKGHELECHNLSWGSWGSSWQVNATVESDGAYDGQWKFQSDENWVTSWKELEYWACARVRPICIELGYNAPKHAPSIQYICGQYNWAGIWSYSGAHDYLERWSRQGLQLFKIFEGGSSRSDSIPRPAELRNRPCVIRQSLQVGVKGQMDDTI